MSPRICANRVRFTKTLIGLPLVATWCEADEGTDVLPLLFGLEDGSALAFFQFAEASDEAECGQQMPFTPFHHIALNVDRATQDAIAQRLEAAEYHEPQTFVLEHGYCRSLYVQDPNGMKSWTT